MAECENLHVCLGGGGLQMGNHREAKSRPSTSDPWNLISEKLCIEVNGERKIIFRSRLNCATNYTYDVCQS